MNKEKFVYKGKEMEFGFEENFFGKDISILNDAGIGVCYIEFDKNLFSLRSNGEDGEYWLEIVMFVEDIEESFSDCIYEMPVDKEEAKEMILDFYQEEIEELIGE